MKSFRVFSLLVVGLIVIVIMVSGCMSLSPSPIAELVGEWQSLDGSTALKVNSDGSFTLTSSGETLEGTLSVSNDYELWMTSKDKKTNQMVYFFIKDNRLFAIYTFVMEEQGSGGIKARWKNQIRTKNEGGEMSLTVTYRFRDDGKVEIGSLFGNYTKDYQLLNETKDIASIVVIETNRYCYVLGDWRGKKMMFLVEEEDYDSTVLKKK